MPVDLHIECVHCRYDLFGNESASCPECGHSVARSVDQRRLMFQLPSTIRLLRKALFTWLVFIIFFGCGPPFLFGLLHSVLSLQDFFLILALSTFILETAGILLMVGFARCARRHPHITLALMEIVIGTIVILIPVVVFVHTGALYVWHVVAWALSFHVIAGFVMLRAPATWTSSLFFTTVVVIICTVLVYYQLLPRAVRFIWITSGFHTRGSPWRTVIRTSYMLVPATCVLLSSISCCLGIRALGKVLKDQRRLETGTR